MTTTFSKPFYGTTVSTLHRMKIYCLLSMVTSETATGNTTVQADCYGYQPWVIGVAAGIPSFLALVLAIILAVVCVLQWSNFSWKQTSGCPEIQEEHEYERSPPRPPDDFYLTVMEETKNVYVNEDQEKHFRRDIQAQAKPPRMNKPRREPPVMEYIYENHPPFH